MERHLLSSDSKSRTVYQSPIKTIFEKFSRQKDVSLVYGDPIELEGKKVVPVAKVRYIVGGGGGLSEGNGESPAGQGEGGGGHISISPLGMYEITEQKTKFKPVVDLKMIIVAFSILTLGVGWILKKMLKS